MLCTVTHCTDQIVTWLEMDGPELSISLIPILMVLILSSLQVQYNTYIVIIIIRLTHVNVWKSMGKPCSCRYFIKSRISYCKSHENLYQVQQVMHNASERAMKSEVCMIKSIIITIVPSYTRIKILLVCCRWHCYSCCTLVTTQTATNSWYYMA